MTNSLRSQYFLGSVITLMLMLALLLWNAESQMQRTLEERFGAELDLAAPLLAAAAAPLLAERDHAGARDLLRHSANASHLVFAELFDARGLSVARVGLSPEGNPAVRSTRRDIVLAGQRLGELRLGIDASALQKSQQDLWRNSLLIGAGVLALGLALLAGWTAWISAHLRRLAEASQRVAAGHYEQVLPGSRVLELSLVADAFNRMSAAIRDKIAALRDSEQQQRSLVASMSGGLLVCDKQGRIRECNEAARRLLALGPVSIGADLAPLLQRQIELSADDQPWTRALRSGEPLREVLLACRSDDGSERWLSVNAEPRFAPGSSSPDGVVCSISDVSRHVQGEQALRALNAELETRVLQRTHELQVARDAAERASQAKSQFLSRMSHELRTPLNAILGFAQLLGMSKERLRSSETEKIVQIERAGWLLLELIDDVLDLSRIEAGEMSTRPEALDVLELVGETTQMLASLASQQGVRVRIEPAVSHWARADRKRLKQVLNNLLSNAIKYNRRGGRVTVSVSASESGEVRVTVTDTGRGMTATELEQLYKPFVRFEKTDDMTPGTGIGLVITRRLIELMGGRIEVSSTAGQGSVFSIWLPACAAPDSATLLPQSLQRTAAGLLRPRRLLYIEDNPANAELLRGLLEQEPAYALSLAANAERGLELLRSLRPHLLLVDIDLPDISGLEVCRRVRADPRTAKLPLIALSANAMAEDIQQALDAGFDRYHTKPLNFQALLKDVDELLNRPAPRLAAPP
ncbi:ATP-binding protein [Roseateles sp.]|uniref:ATP-binding protein n=1 Tax=Roseateles sp. TaxID=1971397 RepID=UPI0037C5DA46